MRPPVTSDPLTILLEHNHWATRRLLDLCSGLFAAQFHERFEMGPGSLHDTLTHVVDCMRVWADRAAGRPPRLTLEGPPGSPRTGHTPAELGRLLDEATADLRALLESSRDRLASPLAVTVGGKPYTFTLAAVLMQPLVHGAHHRAQCLNMLRRLNVPGVSDHLPDLDVVDWQHETEARP